MTRHYHICPHVYPQNTYTDRGTGSRKDTSCVPVQFLSLFSRVPVCICGESMVSPCSVVNPQRKPTWEDILMLCSDLTGKRADAPPLRRLLHKAHAASPRGVAHGRGPRLAPRLFSPGTKQGRGSHPHSHSHIIHHKHLSSKSKSTRSRYRLLFF